MMRSLSLVLTGDVLVRALTGITGLILVRFMAKSDFADYVVITGTANLIGSALSGAFGTLYIVRHKELGLQTKRGEFFYSLIALTAVLAILLSLFNDYFHGLEVVAGLLLLTSVISEFARNVERQELNFLFFSIFNFVRGLSFLLFVAALILWFPTHLTAKDVGVVQALTMALASYPVLQFLRQRPEVKAVVQIFRVVIRENFLLFSYVLLVGLLSQVDVVYLRWWSDEQQIAAFGAAFRYYALLMAVFGAVDKVLQPHLALADSNDEMRALFSRIRSFFLIIVPMIAMAGILAPWILPLIDHGKFPESVPAFQILCVSSALSLVLSPYANVLFVHKKFKFLFVGASLALVANFIFNLILVPRLGAIGSALTILVVGGVMNFTFFMGARKILRSS